MNNQKIKYLLKSIRDQNLAHVSLIVTNNQDRCCKDLLQVVKELSCMTDCENKTNKCNICESIDKNESPNYFYIEPDGKNIKKEQMLELKKKCSLIPVLSKNNVYVIKEAEKLNSSSANTMLKFVEEPFDNCYGFFVTNNKDNVINTIKSRCQLITINYDNLDIIEELNLKEEEYLEYINLLKDYLYKIEVEKTESIMYNKDVFEKLSKDKEKLYIFFQIMLDIYNKLLINQVSEFNFIKVNNINNQIKKIKLITNIVNNFNYNLNLELIMDKFIIEMGEINE